MFDVVMLEDRGVKIGECTRKPMIVDAITQTRLVTNGECCTPARLCEGRSLTGREKGVLG